MKSLAFYETVAQIIPLLFVVMVFEARWFRIMDYLPEARRQERVFFVFILFYVTMGEAIALGVLYYEEDFRFAPLLVSIALATEVAAMVGIAWKSEMADRISKLREQNAQLRAENEQVQKEISQTEREIASLAAQEARLRQQLKELERKGG